MSQIIIGDVHGCYDQLLDLLDKIGPSSDDEIISVGDIVDRGPKSPECVEFFTKHTAIMGNHEYKHVRFRHGIMPGLSPSQKGARDQFETVDAYEEAVTYMETLPFYLDLPDAIVVHAGLQYGVPLPDQDRIVLIGGMSRRRITGINKKTKAPYWCETYPSDAKPIIFGHLNVGKYLDQNNLFAIDTGCCAGGMLTALVLPSFTLYQVPGYEWKK